MVCKVMCCFNSLLPCSCIGPFISYVQVASLFSDFNEQYGKLCEVFKNVTQEVFKPAGQTVSSSSSGAGWSGWAGGWARWAGVAGGGSGASVQEQTGSGGLGGDVGTGQRINRRGEAPFTWRCRAYLVSVFFNQTEFPIWLGGQFS